MEELDVTTIITPTEEWLRQVTAVVRQVLNEQQRVGGARLVRPNTYSALMIVEPTEQIPARAGVLLGSGACKLKYVNSSGNLTDAKHADGTTNVTDTLYNPYVAAAIESGSMVIAGREIVSGKLIAISEDCT